MSLRSWTPQSRRVRPREAASPAFNLGADGSVYAHIGDLLLGSPRAGRDSFHPQPPGRDSRNAGAQDPDHETYAQPGTDDHAGTHVGKVDGGSYDFSDRSTGGHHHVKGHHDNRSLADDDHP